MRLASYNVHKAVGTDRRRDPGRVLEVINGLEADIVVLQEADRRLGRRPTALPQRLIAEHTDLVPAPLAANEVSLGFHGNAVLLRKGLAAGPVARIDLPGLEPRGAVAVEIPGRLLIVGVHLALLRRYRHEQLRALRDFLERQPLPVAVLGDFNEWSPRRGLEPLEGRLRLHAPGLSFHANRPMAALDRIGLSRELELRDAGVEQGPLARRASDHLPIWADVALPASDPAPSSDPASDPA